MQNIVRYLQKSSIREKRILTVSYLINMTFICVMLMFGFGMSHTQNLSLQDKAQAEMILSSMSMVAIIVVLFLQWLTAMQILALFESRKVFNQSIRLLGLSAGRLTGIYFAEMLRMQIFIIPLGWLLSELVYFLYASVSGSPEKVIPPGLLGGAAGLHLIIIICVNLLVGWKLAGTNIIDWIRGKKERVSARGEKKTTVSLGIGIAMILVTVLLHQKLPAGIPQSAVLLLVFLAIPFLYGFAASVSEWIASRITSCGKCGNFSLALYLSRGQKRSVKAIRFLLLYSCILICGLYGMYSTVRNLAASRVEDHIHYAGYVWLEESVAGPGLDAITGMDDIAETDDMESSDEVYQTLSYRARLSADSGIRITGIDRGYADRFEDIDIAFSLDEGDPEAWRQKADDENFDGILLDTDYIDASDLGKEVSYELDGKSVTFTVYGGYVSNNLAEFNGYVGKKYLENQMHEEGQWNRRFYLTDAAGKSLIENEVSANGMGQYEQKTKEDLRNISYEHAVQGTGEIELVCWMIFFCALAAAATCIYMNRDRNDSVVAKLSGIGTDKKTIRRIFTMCMLWVALVAYVPAVFCSILFQKAACGLILSPEILEGAESIFPLGTGLLTGALFTAVMIIIQNRSIRRLFDREALVMYLRRN